MMLASDWLDTSEEADARTLLGFLVLQQLLEDEAAAKPKVIVEILDPDNRGLFDTTRAEVLPSPLIVSHMLAQVSLRRELRAVFDQLFGAGDAEIFLHPASEYKVDGTEIEFGEIQALAFQRNEIALGVRLAHLQPEAGSVRLNPGPGVRFSLRDSDEIVVIADS